MNSFCDCDQDGWCPRYQREQNGRLRQICQGINVDLGTAAAYREQWRQEVVDNWEAIAGKNTGYSKPIPLLLKTNQSPGDALCMTAAVYSLHKAHPGKYRTLVESPYPEIFRYNPDVTEGPTNIQGIHELEMHYPAIHQSNDRAIHFAQAYCEFLGLALGIHIPLLTNRPHLYFSEAQQPNNSIPQEDYWIVCSGGKKDFTNKMWGLEKYQWVVDYLAGRVNFIQVGDSRPNHPILWANRMNNDNMVGKTNLRQLFDVVRHAKGVLCGVSLLMHVAAALGKPAIIIAGGREPVAWNAYPNQHYLHTVGMLPCYTAQNQSGACWRSRVVPLGDHTVLDSHPCLFPQELGGVYTPPGIYTPKCMSIIDPKYVADLILKYTDN